MEKSSSLLPLTVFIAISSSGLYALLSWVQDKGKEKGKWGRVGRSQQREEKIVPPLKSALLILSLLGSITKDQGKKKKKKSVGLCSIEQ